MVVVPVAGTDLPPGHTMVTGMQTVEFDLYTVENAKLLVVWGMNWITTKMPDSHWLTEARLKGAKTVAITVEYSATAGGTAVQAVAANASNPSAQPVRRSRRNVILRRIRLRP